MTANQDEQHLRLLSIFHYVLGAVFALFSCFPVLYLAIGIIGLTEWETLEDEMTRFVCVMLTIIPTAIILAGWTFAICLFSAARFLAGRTHYVFCYVIACIACVFVPLGTALGVFTIIVLVRPSVKSMFYGQAHVDSQNKPLQAD